MFAMSVNDQRIGRPKTHAALRACEISVNVGMRMCRYIPYLSIARAIASDIRCTRHVRFSLESEQFSRASPRRSWREDAESIGDRARLLELIEFSDFVCHAIADHTAQILTRLLGLLDIPLGHSSSLRD